MFKVDLHTHSEASKDGGITAHQYAKILQDETVDYIAVTDHNRVDFAIGLRAALGDRIIVGEEIATVEGELIGLFLEEVVQPMMSVEETIQAIRDQHGLVYVPHPFEKVRHGLSISTLLRVIDNIDIIEVYNSRAIFRYQHAQRAMQIAKQYHKGMAASSDAHGLRGVGISYSIMLEGPNVGNLEQLLMDCSLHRQRPPLRTLLYPAYYRTKKLLGGQRG